MMSIRTHIFGLGASAALLVLLSLSVVGCDSSGPSSSGDLSGDLLGSWEVASSESFVVVTTTRSDRVLGAETIGDGLRMDGIDRSFRYLTTGEGEMDDGINRYRSNDIILSTHSGVPDAASTSCNMVVYDYKRIGGGEIPPDGPVPYMNVTCNGPNMETYAEFGADGRDLFEYNPSRLTLTFPEPVTLSRSGGDESFLGSEVVVDGTIEGRVTQIPADSPTRVVGRTGLDAFHSLNVIPADAAIEFFEDGSYESTYTPPVDYGFESSLTTERGSWSTRDGVLTTQAKTLNGVEIDTGENRPVDFLYSVVDGRLDLELSVEACSEASEPEVCLNGRAESLRMMHPEAVTRLTQGVTLELRGSTP
jgi:hypothetical protein